MSCIDVTLPPAIYRTMPLLLVAAAVILDADGRILIASRPAGKSMAGLWEFPGGKINKDESAEQGLVRELREELGIKTSIGCLSPLSFVTYAYDGFHLLMPVFVCRIWQGQPQPHEGQNLAWAYPDEFQSYEFVPADRPLLPRLKELLG
jgi:8-oxo-dGTP diphosphatase